jgi:hypothetical protein
LQTLRREVQEEVGRHIEEHEWPTPLPQFRIRLAGRERLMLLDAFVHRNRWPISRSPKAIVGFRPLFPRDLHSISAQLFKHMAGGIRDGRPASPGFDLALTRHRLLDAIQKASDSGVRQVL